MGIRKVKIRLDGTARVEADSPEEAEQLVRAKLEELNLVGRGPEIADRGTVANSRVKPTNVVQAAQPL